MSVIVRHSMWRKRGALLSGAILAFGLSFVYLFPGHTAATTGINQELSFEGKVVTSSGVNIPDGTYNMEFTIYTGCTNNTGSGCSTAWTEDYLDTGTNTGGVTFTSGTFQVNLGSICPFSGGTCGANTNTAINWNTYPLYLSLQIGNNSACTISSSFQTNCSGDGVMSPYILLTSTPYALNSNELGGLTSSQYGQLGTTQTFTGQNIFQPTTNINSATIKQTSAASPSADIFNVQGAGGSSDNFIQVTSTATNQGAVNITSLGSNAITLQSGSGTVSLGSSTTLSSTGALTLSSGGTSTLTLSTPASTSTNTGAITIQSGNATVGTSLSAGTVSIDTGTPTSGGNGTIDIGTANATTINIGNLTNNNAANIYLGGGSPTGSQTVNVGYNVGSTAETVNIDSTGTLGGGTINLGSTAAGVYNTNIYGNSTLTPKSGGTVNIGATNISESVQIGDSTASTGTQTIGLGNDGTSGGTVNVTIGCNTSCTGGTTAIRSQGATTISAGTASTWSTIAGNLTIQGGSGTVSLGTSTILTNTGASLTVESASGDTATFSGVAGGNTDLGTLTTTGVIEIGSSNASSDTIITGPAMTTSSKGICISGSASVCNGTLTATPILLDLNQSTIAPGSETAGDCSTTINAGGLYYSAATASNNTTTQELRGCINGAWKDIVTGDQLGIILLGVVPDSGSNPGDVGGITGANDGPCRVAWSTTTAVAIAPCTAYSNGRKVVVSNSAAVTGLSTASSYYHICLNGTNNAPAATAANASETAGLPAFSATAPILCLATVQTGSGGTITNIDDTRIFTNDTKQFISTVAAMAPGWIAVQSAANQVTSTTSANAADVMGVIGVGSSAASGGNSVNAIMVSNGPAYVEAASGTSTTFVVGDTAQTSTTAGYASMVASSSPGTYGTYENLGLVLEPPISNTCTTATNCQFSMYVNVDPK